MSLDLTSEDVLILEKLRIARLSSFFAESLPLCLMEIRQSSTLAIHCPRPCLVDELMSEIVALSWYAWVVVGVHHLSIYFAGEEVYATSTCNPANSLFQTLN